MASSVQQRLIPLSSHPKEDWGSFLGVHSDKNQAWGIELWILSSNREIFIKHYVLKDTKDVSSSKFIEENCLLQNLDITTGVYWVK